MGLVITKIKEHKKIKEMIIKEINNTQQNSFENITSTDWMTPSNIERTYFKKYIKKIIDQYYVQIAKKLNLYNFNITKLITHNWWFQIYNKNSSHNWHTHRSCHFTNVYFLELPKNHLATEIKGHRKLNIKEGDLITFPAYWPHRSPINNTNKQKIIISFNTSYDY